MRKLLLLAALPLVLSACASNRSCCPDCSKCACPTCSAHAGTLTPPSAPAGVPSAAAAPSTPSAPAAAAAVTAVKVYHIPPAKLVETIQQAVVSDPTNLKVASSQAGIIQTDWKDYEGEFHIARRWQERTRYRITVIPDVNDPAGSSRFEVAEETQRRSNDRANWQSADSRPERAAALAQAIDARLK